MEKYSNKELVKIVYIEHSEWYDEDIEEAKELLKKREVTEEEIDKLFLILCDERDEERKRKMSNEGYHPIILVLMAISWPLQILRDRGLKKEGYHRKSKQRISTISFGFLIYLSMFISVLITPEKKELKSVYKEAAKPVVIDTIDWSGNYMFMDSTKTKKKNITWNLDVTKHEDKHNAIVTLKNRKKSIIIKCVGLIREKKIEFYPDTTYTLFENKKISYYDNLFSLAKDGDNIYTYWEALKPFNYSTSNNWGLFRKVN